MMSELMEGLMGTMQTYYRCPECFLEYRTWEAAMQHEQETGHKVEKKNERRDVPSE